MSNVDDIEKLAALKASGALTEAEYETAKSRLLGAVGKSKSDDPPQWMKPGGVLLIIFCVGTLGLIAYGRSEANPHLKNEHLALEILLNPLFFVGLPLGLYWLYRSDFFEKLAEDPSPVTTAKSTAGKPMRIVDMIAVVFMGSVLVMGSLLLILNMTR
jgi:hypothetical protein